MQKQSLALHYIALAFLNEHQGEYLDHDRPLLIDRCVTHLCSTEMISSREAEIATLQAFGERASHSCKAYVDMNLTTSYAVFIRDPRSATLRVFTVAELIELIDPLRLTRQLDPRRYAVPTQGARKVTHAT